MSGGMMKSSWLKLSVTVVSMALLASCAQKKDSANGSEMANNIVGGKASTAKFQKDNGVVGLMIVATDGGSGICTGSLIDKRIVLTAAHCINAEIGSPVSRIYVIFANNMNELDKLTPEQVRAASTGAEHEDFLASVISETNVWKDIALLKLSSDAPADFKLARLPAANSQLRPGLKVIQAGFGRTEALKSARSDSSGVLRQVDGIKLLSLSADGSELTFEEKDKGSCNGDSGGPAFAKSRGQLVVVGVNSRGTSRTSCIEQGIYTNVVYHLAWIAENKAKLLAQADPAPAAQNPPAAQPPLAANTPPPVSP